MGQLSGRRRLGGRSADLATVAFTARALDVGPGDDVGIYLLMIHSDSEYVVAILLAGLRVRAVLITHRARGFRRLESLLSMITLVCGRIPVELPT